MSLLPYDAPPPKERSFENVARCTINRIITIGEAVGQKGRMRELPKNRQTGQTINPNTPYWDMVFETMDAKYADGNPLLLVNSTKLADFNGDQLGNDQRPYIIAAAFAGLRVRSAPFTAEADARFRALGFELGIDPDYDEAEMIGRAFRLKSTVQKDRKGVQLGREFYLPLEAYDADFVFTGTVRTVQSKQGGTDGVEVNSNGAVAPQSIDIAVDETARAAVASALHGVAADDDSAIALLRAANLGNLSLNGTRLIELLAEDKLVRSLAEAGIVRVDGNVLVGA